MEEVAAQLKADASSHRLLLLEDGCPVGEAVWRLAEEKGAAEIGIKPCVPSARGRSSGTQYLHRPLRYLFGAGRLCAHYADSAEENRRARHVYEKLGFADGGISSDVADAAGMQSAGTPAERNIAAFMGTGCSNACPFSYPANKCQKGGFHGCIYEAAKRFAAGGAALAAPERGRRSDGNTPALPATCHASNDAGTVYLTKAPCEECAPISSLNHAVCRDTGLLLRCRLLVHSVQHAL